MGLVPGWTMELATDAAAADGVVECSALLLFVAAAVVVPPPPLEDGEPGYTLSRYFRLSFR